MIILYWYILVCKFVQSIIESCWDSCLCEHSLGWSQAILFGAWLHDAEVSAEEYLNQHGQYGPWITLLNILNVKVRESETVKDSETDLCFGLQGWMKVKAAPLC